MASITHTTKQTLTTSHCSPPTCFDHCLLVYPLPSIADESFLETIFRCKVRRSIFSGFGRHRFAIVELDDAERAAEVCAWASYQLVEEKNSGGNAASQPPTLQLSSEEDQTLAQIAEAVAREQAAQSSRTADLGYLSNLRWNGKGRIYVVPSPFGIQELFDCGGVVPQNKSGKERDPRPMPVREPRGKRQLAEEATLPPVDTPAPRVVRTEGESAAATAFPKHCCQKCGSSAHFTRHCDGSGPSPTEKGLVQTENCSIPAKEAVEKTERRARETMKPPPLPPPGTDTNTSTSTGRVDGGGAGGGQHAKTTFVRTSKDQCKHCGSEDHLSRHCPNK